MKSKQKRKLRLRMTGALLKSFKAGRISDATLRAKGYDPKACRKFHNLKQAA